MAEPDWSALAPPAIAVGDVIQINPTHRLLGGALAFVTEIRSWGILAVVPFPRRGIAPVRLGEGEYQRIGKAPWLPEGTEP